MTDTRLRVGRSWGRTLVEHDEGNPKGRLAGVVDTPELAQEIADAVNAARDATEVQPG